VADALLNERYIKELLRMPPTLSNCDAIQTGAAQTLLDIYDRKVTREEFMAMAGRCLSLYAQCSKMWVLNSIREVHLDGTLTDAKFDEANAEIADIIRKMAEQVIEDVKRLEMCPGSKDPVN
jgi:hypothetical protein